MRKSKVFVYASVLLFFIAMITSTATMVNAAEKKETENAAKTEKFVEGTLQQTVKAAEIKEKPEEGSDTLASLEKGTAVVVYGEPEDSFCRVEYRGIEGYIESGALEQYQADIAENLEQEFQSVEEDTLRTIDEYELLQKEKKTSRIWGAVIAVMVIAIFVVGIISALKQNREKEEDE